MSQLCSDKIEEDRIGTYRKKSINFYTAKDRIRFKLLFSNHELNLSERIIPHPTLPIYNFVMYVNHFVCIVYFVMYDVA